MLISLLYKIRSESKSFCSKIPKIITFLTSVFLIYTCVCLKMVILMFSSIFLSKQNIGSVCVCVCVCVCMCVGRCGNGQESGFTSTFQLNTCDFPST